LEDTGIFSVTKYAASPENYLERNGPPTKK